MTFGLPSWLKSRYQDLAYEVPVWYPSHDQPDQREWLVTNGLGGYASSTICGAHTRRYHGCLVSALSPPTDRHIILSRLDELLTINGVDYELSTNHWASGVVAPTGYKLIESFTTLPAPTWVFNVGGHYLLKQLVMPWGTNQVQVGYFWLPDSDERGANVTLNVRFLAGYRQFHDELRGSAEKHYWQEIDGRRSLVGLDGDSHLHLGWTSGRYERQESWWWGYHWPEEASRGQTDQEDLCLIGSLNADLSSEGHLYIAAGFNEPTGEPDPIAAVSAVLGRQSQILHRAALPRSPETNLLVLASDQLLVKRQVNGLSGLSAIAGYPWFADSGRSTMISMPGLTLAPRRYDEAKQVLVTYSKLAREGLMPDLFAEHPGESETPAADTTLWWAWALFQYYKATKDKEFIASELPALKEVARHYVEGTTYSIKVDPHDGLLRIGNPSFELSWMNARVADIPITPRAGKAVEICALWYNLLGTLQYFADLLDEDIGPFRNLATLTHSSMQKFWNNERQCLYDVLEPGNKPGEKPNDTMRPNQIFAVALPFRAFTKLQEKSILTAMDRELLTPLGLRSLSPTDQSYQGRYGCGFSRADQYHRDLSYHQGTAWPWLLGFYCDALLNVHGPLPETSAKIRILLQPLLNHLMEEGCVGSISEIFDGNSPHIPRGCFAQAFSVAETLRVLATVLRT